MLPDVKHGAEVKFKLNGAGEAPANTLGEPPGKTSPGSSDQVTLKDRVAVVFTGTFPKSRMVPLAGVNDTALAGETVRGSTPPMPRHRAHTATSVALSFDLI